MFRRCSVHRLQAWFAIAILLLGALAPSISAALSHARGGDTSWQQICRSPASRTTLLAQQQEQAPQGDTGAIDQLLMGHCPMCQLHAADLALPPAPAPQLILHANLQHAMPERFFSAPTTAHAWRAAPARAPPLSA